MKRIYSKVVYILLTGLVCCGMFLGVKYYYSQQVKTLEIIKEPEISGETIRSSMANIGKLCTAEYNYTHVEHMDSSREIGGFKIPFTTASFIYSYDGTVMAGIDFTEIKIDKNTRTKIITVTLPEVEIMSSDVDQNSFRLYDEENNIFNPIHVTDVVDSFADLKDDEEQKAISAGLFDRAKENALTLVENFMRGSYDVKDYDIKVLYEAKK